jgi:hypothetical protein
MASPELGNVPAQPQYGEVKQIEAQEKAAPLAKAEEPTTAPPEALPPDGGVAAAQPRPDNIVDVLPPASTAPARTGAPPLPPEQELAYLILGTPGMSRITRSFASQIVSRYNPLTNLGEKELKGEELQVYRAAKLAEQLGPGDRAEED